MNDPSSSSTPARGRRLRRIAAWLVVIAAAILIGVELFARFYLGLGTPPLSQAHPQIEYMFKPDQDVWRFGNRVKINAYGMRSDDFPPDKADPDEFRVMVYGDSVINGGNLTDQNDLATSIIQDRLRESLGRPVVVGNISAGSWGPENLLAHAQTYGTFDADVILVVLSSHDAEDLAEFKPLSPKTHPQEPPFSAVTEGMFRYLPRFLPSWSGRRHAPAGMNTHPLTDAQKQQVEDALRRLVTLGRSSGAEVVLLLHWDRDEAKAGQSEPKQARLLRVAEDAGVPVVSVGEAFRKQIDTGVSPYRDKIHPNATGQRVLADVMTQAIRDVRETP